MILPTIGSYALKRLYLAVTFFLLLDLGHTAFVPFSNCLDSTIVRSHNPTLLQLIPLNVTAFFDTSNSSNILNVTFYGNVTGQLFQGEYLPSTDPSWTNPNVTFGKIEDVENGASLKTTLFNSINFLSYTPYPAPAQAFCSAIAHSECPLSPAFNISRTDLSQLPAWNITHNLPGSFAFTELIITARVQSGANSDRSYACINAFVTPDIGDSLRDLLRYLPLGVLIIVGIATISAAIFSPWGTWDVFRWTSNFGRDEDVLRLVTPGFADCLQYLQFVVLTGSLTLNYPGYYQPVVSRVGWSSLLFNESFVSHGTGSNPVVDGVYAYRTLSDSGMDRMTQLIGMSTPQDAWAAMTVWLLVIVVAVAVLTQVGFALRWVYRVIMNVPPEDLRSKNWYFTVGNAIRVTIGFFILPMVALSMYQFTITDRSPIYIVVLAALVLVGIAAFSVRLVFLFARTRPRSYLFDDIQTVLAYGPLYNTYCDNAATFALIPILVNFLRGIAIGAVQISGVAQIVLLAISEIIFLLTTNAFRPYPSATSMNLYHTCFSVLRIITVLLSIAFVPSLNVAGGPRGWIGYIILLIHACVLVFGFFLNAVQTLVEVLARLAGAGGSSSTDAARGGLAKVFGVRQLSKRMPRADNASHHSLGSNAGMLNPMEEHKETPIMRSRSRSVSLTSTMLLEKGLRSPQRESQMYAGTSDGQITPDAASTFSGRPLHRSGTGATGGIVGLNKQMEAKDPYYRPPRRNTVDHTQDLTEQAMFVSSNGRSTAVIDGTGDGGEGAPAPLKMEDFDESANELNRTKTDYAVREVDFYYGVRGPALSSGTRKLKTGPADPTGPVSSATGWFKGLLGGRQKEKTKGFEVVRSARAPPGLLPGRGTEIDPEPATEPYRDVPVEDVPGSSRKMAGLPMSSETLQRDRSGLLDPTQDELPSTSVVPQNPPLLPFINTGGGIDISSRATSQGATALATEYKQADSADPELPALPRRSSRRTSSVDSTKAQIANTSAIASSYIPTSGTGVSARSTSTRAPLSITSPRSTNTFIVQSSRSHSAFASDQENRAPVSTPPSSWPLRTPTSPTAGTAEREFQRGESVGQVRQHRAGDAIIHPPPSHIAESKSAELSEARSNLQRHQKPAPQTFHLAVNPYGQPGQRSSRFRDD